LSNANTALQFLTSKRIKLVNINASDLVDGRPPVVLGLIWTIILYFQVSPSWWGRCVGIAWLRRSSPNVTASALLTCLVLIRSSARIGERSG
jgi:hypothetical protein